MCETEGHDFVGISPTKLNSRVPTTNEVVTAQLATADWLEAAGLAPAPVAPEASATAARAAFTGIVSAPDTTAQREALMTLSLPEEVRHIVGMLTAYDWQFVHQAQEIRSYVVSKLMVETENPKPEVRLKALGMLGKVTEVGLFTDKVEVKKTDMSDEEINTRIKDKIAAFLKIEDATIVSDNVTDVDEAGQPSKPE